MLAKCLTIPSLASLQSININKFSRNSVFFTKSSLALPPNPILIRPEIPFFPPNFRSLAAKSRASRLKSPCVNPGREVIEVESEISSNGGNNGAVLVSLEEEEEEMDERKIEVTNEDLVNQSMWNQMKEIVKFTGPATGLWLCGPLMSLIDTAVIGQGSSIELAALGPGTVLCDYLSYLFMFLAISTSNMVATSLAKQDKAEVQHQLSILLFVGLACGFSMLFFTKFFGLWALKAFAGSKNVSLLPAANTYAQIRGLAWPAILVGWVAQSASLGMKDSWGPLKALAVASAVNGIGDVVLCIFLGYGIAGAAWATMASQVIAAFMMVDNLNKKGYNAYTVSIPSTDDLLTILKIAAPVFVVMMSKVIFYALITYFATSMGSITIAAHQVMTQTYIMCSTWGEPLSQTAQSFMPELIVNRSLVKVICWRYISCRARMLLKSLLIIGAILGLGLSVIGTSVPWLFPNIFTSDLIVIQEMHKVLIPYFIALAVTPATISLEGTLLAGRDLKFVSLSMSGCASLCVILLMLLTSRGYGFVSCWYALVGFQWARFFLAFYRVLSPNGILYSEDLTQQPEKLKAA